MCFANILRQYVVANNICFWNMWVHTCLLKWKYFHQSFTMPWLWKFLEFDPSPKGSNQPASILLNLFTKQTFIALQLIDIHRDKDIKTYALAQRIWFKHPIWYAVTMQWNVDKSEVSIFFQVSLTLAGGCSFANLNRERWIPIWEWFYYIQNANTSSLHWTNIRFTSLKYLNSLF